MMQSSAFEQELHHWWREIDVEINPLSMYRYVGLNPSNRVGDGLQLKRIRPFEMGDPIDALDMAELQETGAYMTEKYAEERQIPTRIVVDCRVGMSFGTTHLQKRELALLLAATIGRSLTKSRNPVTVVPVAPVGILPLVPRFGAELLHDLLAVHQLPPTSIEDLPSSEMLMGSHDESTLVFLLSDFFPLTFVEDLLRGLGSRSVLVPIAVLDRFETLTPSGTWAFPSSGLIRFWDGQHEVEYDTSSSRSREYAQKALRQHDEALRSLLFQYGSSLESITNPDEIPQTLLRLSSSFRSSLR